MVGWKIVSICFCLHAQIEPIQVASLWTWIHGAVRSLVLKLPAFLPTNSRNSEWAKNKGESSHHFSGCTAVWIRTRTTWLSTLAPNQWLSAVGWNFHRASKVNGNICIEPLIQKAIPWTSWLTANRNAQAAEKAFRSLLSAVHTQKPRVINVDKNAAYPKAIDELKEKQELAKAERYRLIIWDIQQERWNCSPDLLCGRYKIC